MLACVPVLTLRKLRCEKAAFEPGKTATPEVARQHYWVGGGGLLEEGC